MQMFLVLVLNTFANTGIGALLPIMPVMLQSYGFSLSGLSVPFLAIVIARIFAKLFCGRILFLQYKWMCVLAFAVYILTFLLYFVYPAKWMFVGLRFLEGLVEGLLVVMLTDISIHLSQKHNRGFYMGLFGLSFGIGMVTGSLYSGVLYTHFGVDAIFLTNIGIGILGLICALFLKKYDIQKTQALKMSPALLRLLTYYAPAMLRRVYLFTFAIFLPLYVVQKLDASISHSAKLFAIIALVLSILGPASGKFVDKFSARIVIILGTVAMSISSIGIYLGGEFSFFFYTMLISFGFVLPAGMKFFADLIKSHPNRTEVIGIAGTTTEFATIFVALIVPFIIDIDINMPWLFLGVVGMLSVIPFCRKHKD